MSIYIGTNKMSSAYFGTDKISKIYLGTDEVYSSGPLVKRRVGGRIFYINANSAGAYHFYDQDEVEITTQTVEGLANAYYYTKSGGGADKFYAYDNNLYPERNWALSGITTGMTTNTIGSGKTNTQHIIEEYSPLSSTSIWYYADDKNTNAYNGCTDWFIPSMAEHDELRNSGLVNWYPDCAMWASVEASDTLGYYWNNRTSQWATKTKTNRSEMYAFVIRAF